MGAAARAAPEAPNRLLNKRKSQSVTKLARAGDEHGAMRSGDKRGVVSTRNDAASRVAPISHPPPIDDSPNPTNTSSNHSPSHTPGKTAPGSHPSSQESSETPKDFVRLNRRMASQRSRRARSVPRRGEEAAVVKPKTQPGSLPRYLVRRQQQWADEERRRIESAPDPACPPGHIRMADGERLQTLDVLKENHVTLLSELRSLPIAHTSSRLVAQRADLERQLQKVEEGIRIFSRPKVFIKNDA
ncbi:enkurin domain-containing protein 1-like [Amphibalanus amphitrite]|uniref:enkurin domain-containing protein 1-like n=1 Tax=Amphibalanus amphitrite TaxID=1232801 RepID=UPI001C915CDD|nr:enkurin domain-containing protein 1-like [Amphibalanus amphitrite]